MRNARGSDDDRRQIIADLLSDDRSPFTPDDEQALNMARDEILRHWRDTWLKPAKGKAQHRTNCAAGIDKAELWTMVANAVAEALAEHGLATNPGHRRGSSWTKDDERRAQVEKSARDLLRGLGIAKPTDQQVREMVDAIVAKLDSDEGAEPGTAGSVMNTATTAEELAQEAELRGDTRKANRLRTMAANQRAQDRAAATGHAMRYPAFARHVANTDPNDPDIKAMSEFNGNAAIARALANKRKDG